MKKLTKTTLALLTASLMTSAAFAASNDSPSEQLQEAKVRVEALSSTLENMGENVDASVDLNGAYTFDQKEAVYNAKYNELQNQFDSLRTQTTE